MSQSEDIVHVVNGIVDDIRNDSDVSARPAEEKPTVVSPKMALLPPELFDEIVSYWIVIPLHYYSGTYNRKMLPRSMYETRTLALRALSQTCRALREVCMHRLWSRLETCWVPYRSTGSWYKYVMREIWRKTEGLLSSDASLRAHIRTLCFMTSKSQADIAMPALRQLLPALPNLTTIQVLHCNKAGDVGAAVIGLRLPSVRTVIVPTKCNCILKACPNVTHVRCAGGDGAALISALKFCDDVQILDGMIDWSYKDIMTRLLKNAPKLHTLEIRRPVKSFRFETRITAPAIWAEVIPQLSKLPELRTIKLSFPGRETSSDSASIEAARKVLRNSRVTRERKLIIRRVFAPHNTNSQWEDVVDDYRQELFY